MRIQTCILTLAGILSLNASEFTPKGPFGFSPPDTLNLACPNRNFYFHLDGLALQAKQDGMAFAVRNTHSITPIVGGNVMGFSSDHGDWEFNPGIRAGIGYFLNHDHWNVNFDWTWINITNYKHPTVPQGSVLIPLWLTGASSGVGIDSLSLSAVWKSEYNVLDVHFAKPYSISRHFSLQPHLGIRTAWIDQHFSVRYNGTFENVSPLIHHAQNNFWGIGTRVGMDTDWLIGKNGLFFFGNVSASILFGQFDIAQELNFKGAVDGFDFTQRSFQNIPNVELALGFGWETYLVKKQYHLSLRLAYEFQEWFDQLHLRRFWAGAGGVDGNGTFPNEAVTRNNLTLNGFSLRFQFDL